jgi:hypothetical protein
MMDWQKRHVRQFLQQGASNGRGVSRSQAAFIPQCVGKQRLPEPNFRPGAAPTPCDLQSAALDAHAKRFDSRGARPTIPIIAV